jgi:pentatricopeptide repeat protein
MPVCDATTHVCCVSYYAVLSKMELKGVAPDQQTFGTLVKAYSRAKDPAGAEKVLERMVGRCRLTLSNPR